MFVWICVYVCVCVCVKTIYREPLNQIYPGVESKTVKKRSLRSKVYKEDYKELNFI